MKVLAYFLYGDDREYQHELEFSIRSALRFLKSSDDIVIRVICDRDQFGKHLPIERLVFSPAEFADWTNDRTYFFRAKIGALLKAIDHYQCPTVLLDTDTFFTDHPAKLFDRISPTRSLMHRYESTLRDTPDPGWKPILAKIGDGIDINGIAVKPDSPMYNSGAIGIDPSHKSLLQDAFEVLDRIYDIYPVFNVEQFAVGAALSQKTQIQGCANLVTHYWGSEKEFIRVLIEKGLERGNVETLLEDDPPFQDVYPNVRKRDHIITILQFLKHRDNHYRRAQVAYRTALFYAQKDIGYANAWAGNSLQSLELARYPFQPSDFPHFQQGTIDKLSWMSPIVKRSWLKFWQQMN